jgi:phosphoglycolate phosphatase-like HAD superfamily hydrolase
MESSRLSIFDLDGTLIHFHHDFFFDRIAAVSQDWGFLHVRRETVDAAFRSHSLLDHIGLDHRDGAQVKMFFDQVNLPGIPDAVVIEGALETIEHLVCQGHHLALATARSHTDEEVREYLKGTGLLKHITLVSTWSNGFWTDKVEQIKQLCHHVSTHPSNAIMVGDMPSDITSAHRAGVGTAVAVLSGGVHEQTLLEAKPHYLFTDITSIPETLTL